MAPTPGDPPSLQLPPGRSIELPHRGRTFVREVAGPPGSPTLFLLHGLGATAAVNWFTCFEPLARSFRIVTMDHRGHGRGLRSPRHAFRLEDCADDVIAVADMLGIPRLIPVGYSMGGPIAQLTWRRHPDRVAGLVLCATSRNFRGTPRRDMAQVALAASLTTTAAALRLVPKGLRRQVVRSTVNRRMTAGGVDIDVRGWVAEELGRSNASSMVEAARSLGTFSSSPWIGDVDVPTAVLVTTQDDVVRPHRQYKLAAAIPDAEVFEVAGDHSVCGTDPAAFVPVLVRACRSVASRAGAANTDIEGTGSAASG